MQCAYKVKTKFLILPAKNVLEKSSNTSIVVFDCLSYYVIYMVMTPLLFSPCHHQSIFKMKYPFSSFSAYYSGYLLLNKAYTFC